MVGALDLDQGLEWFELPLYSVVLKTVLLPFVSYALVLAVGGTKEDEDFAFIYGLLPVCTCSLRTSAAPLPPTPLAASSPRRHPD